MPTENAADLAQAIQAYGQACLKDDDETIRGAHARVQEAAAALGIVLPVQVPAAGEPRETPSLSPIDRSRIEWCIATIREIADLGRDKPLGDLYPQAVMVVSALKVVLQPNIG